MAATVPATQESTMRPTTLPRRLTATGLAVLVLAGCSGGIGGGADSGAARSVSGPVADESGGRNAPEPTARDADGAGGDSTGRTSARVLPGDRDIVYRGRITVRVRDVSRAADRAEDLALEVDGVVFSEETSVDPVRRALGEAHLTLRVPPASFTPTLDALGALGRELSRTRTAQDVTTELADVDSRVRSQERSVARVRALLSEADTIGEVVQVESELARREADLESLQAQLARLRDVTDLATVDVTFLAHGRAAPEPEEDDLGFLSGLRGGWDAFVEMMLVALTVLGALLPFAVAASVIGLPAYALLRSRRRPAAPGPAAES
jgi:hypothetical protein